MRTYSVGFEDNLYFAICNGAPSGKSFDNANSAWKYAKRLAKQYAQKHDLGYTYTTHPDGSVRAAYVVS